MLFMGVKTGDVQRGRDYLGGPVRVEPRSRDVEECVWTELDACNGQEDPVVAFLETVETQ